uniref:Uncharacterized protein n=1 Tax=Oryza brachyantha TaxID=4533 RepID=J3LC93_ORYBR
MDHKAKNQNTPLFCVLCSTKLPIRSDSLLIVSLNTVPQIYRHSSFLVGGKKWTN